MLQGVNNEIVVTFIIIDFYYQDHQPLAESLTNEKVLTIYMLKQVCMLNTRLAAAESMTHDVIRDLLGVKLDMTNYAVSLRLAI